MMRRQSGNAVQENDIRMRTPRTRGTTNQRDTPPASPTSSNQRAAQACCLCWFSSYLTVKNTDDIPERSNDTKLGTIANDEDRLPTYEELSLWGESFEKLMKSPMGRKVFRDFLRSEYSEENLLFWLACEDMKKEQHADGVEEKARLIYEDYISILSPKEVSLDSRVREVINSNMAEPTPNTFDEAQLQIFTLMHRDSYPRFLNSQTYKKLVQELS